MNQHGPFRKDMVHHNAKSGTPEHRELERIWRPWLMKWLAASKRESMVVSNRGQQTGQWGSMEHQRSLKKGVVHGHGTPLYTLLIWRPIIKRRILDSHPFLAKRLSSTGMPWSFLQIFRQLYKSVFGIPYFFENILSSKGMPCRFLDNCMKVRLEFHTFLAKNSLPSPSIGMPKGFCGFSDNFIKVSLEVHTVIFWLKIFCPL